jgi:Zn-dependent protease
MNNNNNNNNIRVGNLFGIPFYINPSWFFVAGLITLVYGSELAQFPQLTGILPWFLGLVVSLLLFSSVVVHELGHSFVAISQGIEVKSITLFIFGGLAALGKESETPLQAFLVAIAGPLVSLLLFGIFTIVSFTIPLSPPLQAITFLLATINLVLALFNMIPGLPLDGGNVLKALVWKITGNPQKGVIFAGRFGQIFGWLAIVVGFLGTARIIPFGSFWTILIGFFVLQNAGFAAQSAKIEDKLNNLTAADAVTPNSPVIPSNLSLREFANEYVIGKKQWRKFLVTNEQGTLMGVLDTDDLKTIPTSTWTETLVKDLIKSADKLNTVVDSLSLLQVVKILEQKQDQSLIVVKEDGFVLGLLEKASIIELLQKKALTA